MDGREALKGCELDRARTAAHFLSILSMRPLKSQNRADYYELSLGQFKSDQSPANVLSPYHAAHPRTRMPRRLRTSWSAMDASDGPMMEETIIAFIIVFVSSSSSPLSNPPLRI